MAGMPRLVVPGYPHHVVQRGVRSIDIFSSDEDRSIFLQYMREEADRFDICFYAWCLMTNHVHLIAVPENENSLARAIGEAHRRYTRRKNFKEGVRGYLFQGRFSSCVLDQKHLLAAARYVECNPVAAKMVVSPLEYRWSSVWFNCGKSNSDPLIRERFLPALVDDWKLFLAGSDSELEQMIIKKTKTGRPSGSEKFQKALERLTGKQLMLKKPGRRRLDKK